MFVYQLISDRLELKKTKVFIMLLAGNQRGYTLLKLPHYILFS